MQTIKFVVDETAYAFWDPDLGGKNLEFLRGINSDYFSYVARVNAANLRGDDRQSAALCLRIAYSQALETLFALLCSYVQAPSCALGWMLSYKLSELRSLVQKISEGRSLYSRLKDRPVSWVLLAKQVHSGLPCDRAKVTWIWEGFGELWTRLAHEFLDQRAIDEYNSAKHGLRTEMGGFSLSVGGQDGARTSQAPGTMHCIGGSVFGTSYFTRERPAENDPVNLRPRRNARNWDPANIVSGLQLLSMSIQNVTSFLQMLNGAAPDSCKFTTPIQNSFGAPWEHVIPVQHINLDTVVEPGNIRPSSREEILNSYSEAALGESEPVG